MKMVNLMIKKIMATTMVKIRLNDKRAKKIKKVDNIEKHYAF